MFISKLQQAFKTISDLSDRDHKGLRKIDHGDECEIQKLSTALSTWLKRQAIEEEVQEDGTIKQKMGKAPIDLLNKLKSGSKTTIQKLKEEGSISQKFNKKNFDLITWFMVS